MAREQGRVATGPGALTGGGVPRGFPRESSRSPRPAKRALPADLDTGDRRSGRSTGTPHSNSVAPGKNGSAPNLASPPRGYVRNESGSTTTRNTNGGRLRKAQG